MLETVPPPSNHETDGSGQPVSCDEIFDLDGNVIWYRDERGVITRFVYGSDSGWISQRIDDVNTSLVSDEPAGWVSSRVTLWVVPSYSKSGAK